MHQLQFDVSGDVVLFICSDRSQGDAPALVPADDWPAAEAAALDMQG
jgi:hypothetical protein